MTTSMASLHKILKDETRRKILVTVNQSGAMTYTELLNSMELVSTGLLNYHLKVLGDLLVKDDAGKYLLSEKGNLALKLISEFPEVNQEHKRMWRRRAYIAIGIGQVAYFTIALTFFFLGYIDLFRLSTTTSAVIIATITIYFMWRTGGSMPAPGSSLMHRRIKIAYISGGMVAGLFIAFLGGAVLLHTISDFQGVYFGGHNPLYLFFWSPAYLVFSVLIAPALGAYVAYYFGKRRGFEQPKWAIWLDSHLG
jgi:DNA-binding transcriptional ArsR family regulator